MSLQDTDTYVSDPGPHKDTVLEIMLAQNHPNPFNPSTRIAFMLPEAADVRLEVYDVLGRRVVVLVSEWRQAGRHTVDFDATGLAGGVYISRLQVSGATDLMSLPGDENSAGSKSGTNSNPSHQVLTRIMTLVK